MAAKKLGPALGLIIFLLPTTLSEKHMKLQVIGNFDPTIADVIASFSGSYSKKISEEEERTWKLTEDSLLYGAKVHFGALPAATYTTNPSHWADLFQTNNWTEITRILEYEAVTVLSVTAQPKIVMEHVIYNNNTVSKVYKIDISHNIKNSVISNWITNGKLTIGQNIGYKYDIGLLNSGGTLSMDYTSAWGNNVSLDQFVNVGRVSSVKVEVGPGKTALAQVLAMEGRIKLKVDYIARLTGHVGYQFETEHKGRNFWNVDIKTIMSNARIEPVKKSSEVIDITFYRNSKIKIENQADSNDVSEFLF